ncbi:family 10 glycosylhydrolase, partial [Escherichia coli]|nr:family 10 glycosylhydrolase [Escherichia coli]
LQRRGRNTVGVQVKPDGTALGPSKRGPGAERRTGKSGEKPGDEPRQGRRDEAHKRGRKGHAGYNPERRAVKTKPGTIRERKST